jgi:hypothetical protein
VTAPESSPVRCPHCGYGADPGDRECPLCGSPLDASGGAGPPAPGDGNRGTAWDRGTGRFPEDFLTAWKESVLSPSRFFAGLEPGVPLWRAVLYYLVFAVVGSGLNLMWTAWLGGPGGAAELYGLTGLSMEQVQLVGFLATPFLALVGLGFFCLLYHLLVMLLVERRRGLRETARVLSYAWAGPQVFLGIPFVGGMVAGVWSVVLMVIGIREHHRTSTLRAAGVALVPVLLFVLVPFVVFVLVVVGAVGGAWSGLPGA